MMNHEINPINAALKEAITSPLMMNFLVNLVMGNITTSNMLATIKEMSISRSNLKISTFFTIKDNKSKASKGKTNILRILNVRCVIPATPR